MQVMRIAMLFRKSEEVPTLLSSAGQETNQPNYLAEGSTKAFSCIRIVGELRELTGYPDLPAALLLQDLS